MHDSQQLLRDYVADPDAFWDGNERQASKLRKFFDVLTAKVGGSSTAVLDRLDELARSRVAHGSPTLFLTSAGSSGSHWLGDALAASGCFSCGEVYFPPKIVAQLAAMDDAARALFLDKLHLLHSRSLDPELERAWLINLAHNARLDKLGELSARTRKVLLKRDLVDIVLSRTYRKQEYRDYMSAGASDEAYLESQIGYVQRFYTGAKRASYDVVIAYEDMKADLSGQVLRIHEALGLAVAPAEVRAACDELHQTLARDDKPVQDNRFTGEARPAPPGVLDRIQQQLGGLLVDWGYPAEGRVARPEAPRDASTEARARTAPKGRHFSVPKPAPADIVCVVAGQRLDLGSHRSEIHAHFATKPRDEHLFAQLRSIARKSLQPQGEQLCGGAFALGDFEPVRLPDDLTWAEDPLTDRRWLWLFHGWSFTPALLALGWFVDEPVSAAQRRLLDLALDWSRKNHGTAAPSPMSWHDHATGLRLEQLLRIWEVARGGYLVDADACQEILQMVVSHCSTLARDSFYTARTNHGYDQMIALLSASQVFCELEGAAGWRDLALERLAAEVRAGFTSEGVHTENSPGYHASMLHRLVVLQKMLKAYGLQFDFAFDDVLDRGLRFLAQVTRPDGRMPIIGDTQARPVSPSFRKCTDYASHPVYTFVQSGGAEGQPDEETVHVYEESGYAIFRDAWTGPGGPDDTVHMVFKCGHLSRYHRQDDDLSIVLYAHGGDWLIDAGLYRYEEKEDLRRFVRSDVAHNLPRLAGVDVNRQLPDPERRPRMQRLADEGAAVTATTNMYPGFELRRTVRFDALRILVEDEVVEQDELLAGRLRAVEVLFHLPDGVQVDVGDQEVVCSRADGRRMTLRNVGASACEIDRSTGDESNEVPSWTSPLYGEVAASQVVRFTLAEGVSRSAIEVLLT